MNSECTVFESRCGKQLHPAEFFHDLSWYLLWNAGIAPLWMYASSLPNTSQVIFHPSSCQLHYVEWAMCSVVRQTVNKKWETYPLFWALRKGDRKYLEGSEMQCWRRMEKISWIDRVKIEDVLYRAKEKRNILHTVNRRKANWIGQILLNTLLQER